MSEYLFDVSRSPRGSPFLSAVNNCSNSNIFAFNSWLRPPFFIESVEILPCNRFSCVYKTHLPSSYINWPSKLSIFIPQSLNNYSRPNVFRGCSDVSFKFCFIHPRKLTWIPKRMVLEKVVPSKNGSFLVSMVKFLEGKKKTKWLFELIEVIIRQLHHDLVDPFPAVGTFIPPIYIISIHPKSLTKFLNHQQQKCA